MQILIFLFINCLVYLTLCRPTTFYSIEQEPGTLNIALTFDDGPHKILTPKLLDILKQKGVKATFFVMGIKVEMHPKIVLRCVQEGHEIANHAWNHPILSKINLEQVHEQLRNTTLAIQAAAKNYIPSVMRPPYGNTNRRLNNHIANVENLTVILWSLDTNDWKRPQPIEIVKKITEKSKSGTVILCHDIHPGTIEAIPAVVDALLLKGFKFLTVSEMINKSKK
jgi:peptidoglycan/xylan/chitin deacetylase (PgdA/CDA1 family)